jgi:L-serine deaminase
MALAQEDIREIQQLIAQAHNERPEVVNANVRYELELRDRMLRVEEELKHQRELMLEGFKQMDKRFEQVDKRFEQVDKRFEQFAKHLELMDKRFDQMQAESSKRFEALTSRIDHFMIWSFATTLTVGGVVVALIKYH